MIVPAGIQDYQRYDLPKIRLLNLYAEQSPASRQGVIFLPRPALKEYADLGTGPIRGIYQNNGALGGALFVVSGTSLFKDGVSIGTIPGTGRVSMAASATQLLIANGLALYLTAGISVAAVAFPDSAGVSSVAFINGYFIASRSDTQRFYWSAILDGATWDALDFASAERAPDNIVAIWIVSDQLWIFGETTTEIWVTTGDADIPFQRVDGRLFDQGCAGADTIAKLDNTIFWVGSDYKVLRGDSVPLRVSDHAIEEATQGSVILNGWVYPWQGNLFYVLATDSGTKVLNVASGQWAESGSYGRDNWRTNCGVTIGGQVLAGDDETGKVWELTYSEYSDGGDVIERRFTALVDQAAYIDNIALDASSGEEPVLGTEPVIECRLSRDQGNTFGPYRMASLGQQGDYRKRIVWRRWGMVDNEGAVFDFRITDPTPWRLSSIRMNDGQSGRGRGSNG
jgi:Phage stabilisation protein